MVSRLFFISTDGPMAVQMSFVCHTKQVVMIAESFLKKSVSSGAPINIAIKILDCCHVSFVGVTFFCLPFQSATL